MPKHNNKHKIITEHVGEHAPRRTSFAWHAYREGEYDSGPHGWGEDEATALKDLKDQLAEQENDQ